MPSHSVFIVFSFVNTFKVEKFAEHEERFSIFFIVCALFGKKLIAMVILRHFRDLSIGYLLGEGNWPFLPSDCFSLPYLSGVK